jgi:hypothetical protein
MTLSAEDDCKLNNILLRQDRKFWLNKKSDEINPSLLKAIRNSLEELFSSSSNKRVVSLENTQFFKRNIDSLSIKVIQDGNLVAATEWAKKALGHVRDMRIEFPDPKYYSPKGIRPYKLNMDNDIIELLNSFLQSNIYNIKGKKISEFSYSSILPKADRFKFFAIYSDFAHVYEHVHVTRSELLSWIWIYKDQWSTPYFFNQGDLAQGITNALFYQDDGLRQMGIKFTSIIQQDLNKAEKNKIPSIDQLESIIESMEKVSYE